MGHEHHQCWLVILTLYVSMGQGLATPIMKIVTVNMCIDKKIIRLGSCCCYYFWFYNLLSFRYLSLVMSCFQSCSIMIVTILWSFHNIYHLYLNPVHFYWLIMSGAPYHLSTMNGAGGMSCAGITADVIYSCSCCNSKYFLLNWPPSPPILLIIGQWSSVTIA